MSHELLVEIEPVEGALLRVLGTVERRGFGLRTVTAATTDAHHQSLRLQLEGDRDPQILCRQLERLVDVRQVHLLAETTTAIDETPAHEVFQATWLQ
jgi:acetolactate synthase regulatory subunit